MWNASLLLCSASNSCVMFDLYGFYIGKGEWNRDSSRSVGNSYLCNVPTVFDSSPCYLPHCLQTIPQASWPNLAQGIVIFGTFIYIMYHSNQTTKRALAGMKDKNTISFSVYLYFLQACSIWAIFWSVYRIFQTPDNDGDASFWHGIAFSMIMGISEAIEFSIIVFMAMDSVGAGALLVTGVVAITAGVIHFAFLLYFSIKYPGCNQVIESDKMCMHFLSCFFK